MNMNEFMTIPGTTYIVTPDLKIINSKTNKENRCTNISVLMDDGLRHGFRRERLIYAAKNNINPLHIPKYIIVNKNGDGMERYDFYKKHKRGSVKCRYPFDVNEYEKLIDCLKKKERPLFIMNYIKDIENYCKFHLEVSNEEAYELAISAIMATIDNVENGVFPQYIKGYILGTSKKMLSARIKYNKTFLNRLDKRYE